MQTVFFIRTASAAAALAGLLATAPAHAFSSLVVFGDSLSDKGNLYALSGGAIPTSPPYYQGRFSNGPVAVEILAQGLGLSGASFQDYAIAGAHTDTTGNADAAIGRSTGMLTQLQTFQNTLNGGAADANALYFVWGGANDMRAALQNPPTVGSVIGSTINNLVTIVSTLYNLGARNFLLPNLPDLGLTPEAREADAVRPGSAAGATQVAELFNGGLAQAYGRLESMLPDEHFNYFDAMSVQRSITANSPANGFTNVSQRCLTSTSLCANPENYLYWDNIHPTAVAHQVLAGQMLAQVPEPSTILTVGLAMLALMGTSARRRRQG